MLGTANSNSGGAVGLMGVTAACARCHDHKFDPIPSKDYYSLHGVFASSTEPREGPLLEPVRDTPAYRAGIKPGESWNVELQRPGTFIVNCGLHSKMTTTVTVER